MTTGWGNEQAQGALRRTLSGGSSGRWGVFVLTLAFVGIGVLGGSIVLTVAAGAAALATGVGLARALRDARAADRLGRDGARSRRTRLPS